jgi:hypothetical protein
MDSSQPSQFAQYIPILMLLGAAIGFAAGVLAISVLLGKFAKTTKAKDMAYECGANPIGEAGAFLGEVPPRRDVIYPVRHRSCVSLSVGGRL